MNDYTDFLPPPAVGLCRDLIHSNLLEIKVVRPRKTRHGDFRRISPNRYLITINQMDNPYLFLTTLVHEIAHFNVTTSRSFRVKPHGQEWKQMFKSLMLPFLTPQIFPEHLLGLLAKHLKNPKATTESDLNLTLAFKKYDLPSEKIYIFELDLGDCFTVDNGTLFVRGEKRRKRYLCTSSLNRKKYLFSPQTQVIKVECNDILTK